MKINRTEIIKYVIVLILAGGFTGGGAFIKMGSIKGIHQQDVGKLIQSLR